MPDTIECPRCGTTTHAEHRRRNLVLALTRWPRNGARACVDADLYPQARDAGYYW